MAAALAGDYPNVFSSCYQWKYLLSSLTAERFLTATVDVGCCYRLSEILSSISVGDLLAGALAADYLIGFISSD